MFFSNIFSLRFQYITAHVIYIHVTDSQKPVHSNRSSPPPHQTATGKPYEKQTKAYTATVLPPMLSHLNSRPPNCRKTTMAIRRGLPLLTDRPHKRSYRYSSNEWITTPERSLGSNHVVLGGMMLPVSAISINCCIDTG